MHVCVSECVRVCVCIHVCVCVLGMGEVRGGRRGGGASRHEFDEYKCIHINIMLLIIFI